MSHFLSTIKTFDLLLYKDGKTEYLGMILIRDPQVDQRGVLTLKREIIFFSPGDKNGKNRYQNYTILIKNLSPIYQFNEIANPYYLT